MQVALFVFSAVIALSSCQAGLKFESYPEFGQDVNNAKAFNSRTLYDVEMHSEPGANGRYVNGHSVATWAHEGVHGVSTDLCIKNCPFEAFKFFCAYYVLNNRWVKVENPKIVRRKEHCAPLLAPSLKIGRYEHYFTVDSHPAHNSPNYILEEWNAYITGMTTVLESWNAGTWNDDALTNSLQGAPEFAIFYTSCLAAYIQHEPDYLKQPNVLPFIKFQMERSFELYHRSRDPALQQRFPGLEDQQFDSFVTDPAAKVQRDAVKQLFGEDFWTQTVLAGKKSTAPAPPVTPPKPATCQYGAWSEFGACSASCGTGIKSRTRDVKSGTGCTESSESVACDSGKPCAPLTKPPKDETPDVDVKSEFNPDDYTFERLGLIDTPSKNGGNDKKYDITMRPDLEPVTVPRETCWPAIVKQSGTSLLEYTCEHDLLGVLDAGIVVQQRHTHRTWDNSPNCAYGYLADVRLFKADGTYTDGLIREDALIILPMTVDCAKPVFGQIKKAAERNDRVLGKDFVPKDEPEPVFPDPAPVAPLGGNLAPINPNPMRYPVAPVDDGSLRMNPRPTRILLVPEPSPAVRAVVAALSLVVALLALA